MRVSVSKNFEIPRWSRILFFPESKLSGGVGMKKPYLENIGRRFGRLVAVEYVGVKSGSSVWRFRCDCGAMHEASMSAVNRKHNPTRSCGFARPGELSRSLSTPLGWRVTAFRLSISDPRPQSPLMPYGPPARPVCLRSSCAGVSPTCAATARDPTHFAGKSPA